MKIRNKLVALLCAVTCVVSLVGCGGAEGTSGKGDKVTDDSTTGVKEDSADGVEDKEGDSADKSEGIFDFVDNSGYILKINGIEYDLTQDFVGLVDNMLENDLFVLAGPMNRVSRTEQWYFVEGDERKKREKGEVIPAMYNLYVGGIYEGNSRSSNEPMYTCVEIYETEDRNDMLTFETMEGITQETTKEELEEWQDLDYICNFTYTDRSEKHVNRAILYVDGKKIDISSYEQQAEEILEDFTIDAELQKEKAVFDSVYYHSLEQITLGTGKFPQYLEQMKSEYNVQDNYYTVQSLDKDSPLYEDAKSLAMLRLAVQDAYDKLWNDEISQFCLVSYFTELDYITVRIEVVQ